VATPAAGFDDRQLGELADRGNDGPSSLGELGSRAALHRADQLAAQAPPRGPVAHSGDLALICHQCCQFELWPALDLLSQRDGLFDRVHRGALRSDLDPPPQGPPAGVEVDADPHRRRTRPQHGLDRVEVLGAVDHHDRRVLGVGDGAQRQLPERVGVGSRVGEQQVLEALFRQPQRLRQGEGHQPGVALVAAEDALEQRPAAQRLARHPDRLCAGPREHRVAVGPHCVEVDEGEWSLDLFEDLL
jgi:hypothetical protein